MTGYISQHSERYAYDGRVACCHTIHSVIEIGSIGNSHDYNDCQEDKEYPSCFLPIFSTEGKKLTVI